MTFWSAWEGDSLAGVGALKQLSADHGEVKSIHTAESVRRRGVGAAIVHHIIECPPFGDYVPDRNSVFMTLVLPSS